MLATELMRKIGSGPLPPVLVFLPGKAPFGKEPFEPMLADRAIDRIVAELVDPSMKDMAYTAYYADETSVSEIMNEANTLPFLVERRVVVVRNAERYMEMGGEKNSPLAPLLAYLESPNPATQLLIVSKKSDKRKRAYKAFEEAGAVVECPQLTDEELGRWVAHEVELRGKKLTRAAIHTLLEKSGARLGDVSNAVQIVCTFAGAKQEVSEEDVRMACADVAEDTAFVLTDAIAASDTSKALGTLQQLLAMGKAPDEILGLINWLLETAYKAAPESHIAQPTPFQTKKVMPLVQKWGFAKLCKALPLCTETHFMIRSTGVDAVLALEMLVIRLAAPNPPKPARR